MLSAFPYQRIADSTLITPVKLFTDNRNHFLPIIPRASTNHYFKITQLFIYLF